MRKITPVLDKVQGKMAGVLKEENWPNRRESQRQRGDEKETERGRNERERIYRGGYRNDVHCEDC